ncbi:hypothetical protein VZO05_07195 [Aggregatilineales bacterium SYSU G02658]
MSNLDDLRQTLDDFDDDLPQTRIIDEEPAPERRFLGLKASERAVLAVLLFLASLLLGAGVLIVTGRVVL